MSTNASTTEKETVSVSAKVKAAIQAVVKAEGGLAIALDNYRNVAKSETVRLGLEDKKALTAILFASGDTDARRVSEIVGFVFPASDSPSIRKELDKAMEVNAKETDNKKRIAKPVLLALQRDKTGTLTLAKAIADHKAGTTQTRTPGGQTNQTTPAKAKKKTAEEIEAELEAMIQLAMKFAKENGYDAADFAAVSEAQSEEVFKEEEETTEE